MSAISTVIFDLGGVILNLNQDLTLKAFEQLGADLHKVNFQSLFFTDFETGKIGAQEFRNQIRTFLKQEVTDAAIDEAWNAMLLDLPEHRLKAIEQLRKTHRIYLLSNTNSIHIDAFNNYFKQQFEPERWVQLFDKIYYSYEIGLRKPNADIYEYVTADIQMQPEHCLFIDDSLANINGAADAGLKTIHACEPLSENLWQQIKAAVFPL
jgi:putative hydrolase of the HAD superfamily